MAVQGTWRAGTGEVVSAGRWPPQAGAAAWVDVAELSPEDDAALADVAGRPRAAQGAPRRQGPDPRAGRARLAARRAGESTPRSRPTSSQPDQRSYDLADLTLRYLKRELRQDTGDADQLTLDAIDDTGASDVAMLHAPRRCSTWPRRSTTRSRSTAAPGCWPTSSCR